MTTSVGQLVEIEIPGRPEFVAVARMAVSALAGLRPGLTYERIEDLRIVISEVCTSAIESGATRLHLRCLDDVDRLEIQVDGPAGTFDGAVEDGGNGEDFRFSLVRALVDEAELRAGPAGTELCLILKRDLSLAAGDL